MTKLPITLSWMACMDAMGSFSYIDSMARAVSSFIPAYSNLSMMMIVMMVVVILYNEDSEDDVGDNNNNYDIDDDSGVKYNS